MLSIIIPAHNEAAVIARTLGTLVQGAKPDELEIIVVCNGCKDESAKIAAGFGPTVRVIETNIPSKSNALNMGDQAARGFPRFYLDADVVVSLDAIRQVAEVLGKNQALAAAPEIEFDLSQSSWFVKQFYDIWQRLPYLKEGMIGSGLYALSQKGRSRFEKFPAITADDGYVRLLFAPDERMTVTGCRFRVTPPRSLDRLLKIKTRAYFGDLELAHTFPELLKNQGKKHGNSIKKLAANPGLWPALLVYLYIRIFSRLRGRWRWRYGDHKKWDRDESSRQVPSGQNAAEIKP